MRIAAFSDIHGHLAALEAMLANIGGLRTTQGYDISCHETNPRKVCFMTRTVTAWVVMEPLDAHRGLFRHPRQPGRT